MHLRWRWSCLYMINDSTRCKVASRWRRYCFGVVVVEITKYSKEAGRVRSRYRLHSAPVIHWVWREEILDQLESVEPVSNKRQQVHISECVKSQEVVALCHMWSESAQWSAPSPETVDVHKLGELSGWRSLNSEFDVLKRTDVLYYCYYRLKKNLSVLALDSSVTGLPQHPVSHLLLCFIPLAVVHEKSPQHQTSADKEKHCTSRKWPLRQHEDDPLYIMRLYENDP